MESKKPLNIYQRILAIMEELKYIQKEDKKVNNMYRFVSHDQVTAKIHPLLVTKGIVAVPSVKTLTQEGNRTSVCLEVKFVNVDDPSDFVQIESWGFGVDSSDKGPGKAVSYAFKYAVLKLFCLETGDDPDQDTTTKYEPESNTVMTVKEFTETVKERTCNKYSLNSVGNYLIFLKNQRKVSIEKIMSQALEPSLIHRFCEGWSSWYESILEEDKNTEEALRK